MDTIIRGTTPTVKWVFSHVDVDTISEAIFTVHKKKEVVIEKDIQTATIDTDTKSISWTLTQNETLSMKNFQEYSLHCDWVLMDGTRGAGKSKRFLVGPAGKDGVIGNG